MSANSNSADAHSVFSCIPLDICNIVAEYTVPLKLLDWININKINWNWLSLNPAAFGKKFGQNRMRLVVF